MSASLLLFLLPSFSGTEIVTMLATVIYPLETNHSRKLREGFNYMYHKYVNSSMLRIPGTLAGLLSLTDLK